MTFSLARGLFRHENRGGVGEFHRLAIATGGKPHSIAFHRLVDHPPQQRAVVICRERGRDQPLALRRHLIEALRGRGQSGGIEQRQVPAERAELHRRRVAVLFHAVEGRRFLGIVGGDAVAERDTAARAAHPHHFREGARGLAQVMEGEAAGDDVERFVGEWQRVNVAAMPFHIGDIVRRR
jgi:hypothetical protein